MPIVIQRIWDILVGTLMILLSIAFQLIFFVLLLFPLFAVLNWLAVDPKSGPYQTVFFVTYLIIFNAASCFDYFRRRIVNVGLGSGSSIFFLLPRGIDRILFGSDGGVR